MSTTGTNVIDRINNYANDSTHAVWSATKKLEAVNAAIDKAMNDGLTNQKLDTSITLAATTREYTPTATDVTPSDGFALAYVTPDSPTTEIKVRLHRVYQRVSAAAWTIVVPYDIASAFNGNVLTLAYNARHARLSAASGSVELPLDYLFYNAMWFLSGASIISKANNDRKVAQQQMDFYFQLAERSKPSVTRYHQKLPMAYETPAPQGGGRYGQFIVNG